MAGRYDIAAQLSRAKASTNGYAITTEEEVSNAA